jgi:hypothetical protein
MREVWCRLQPPAYVGSSFANFSTLKMEAICPPKRRFTQDLHGTISQKTHSLQIQIATLSYSSLNMRGSFVNHESIPRILFISSLSLEGTEGTYEQASLQRRHDAGVMPQQFN